MRVGGCFCLREERDSFGIGTALRIGKGKIKLCGIIAGLQRYSALQFVDARLPLSFADKNCSQSAVTLLKARLQLHHRFELLLGDF